MGNRWTKHLPLFSSARRYAVGRTGELAVVCAVVTLCAEIVLGWPVWALATTAFAWAVLWLCYTSIQGYLFFRQSEGILAVLTELVKTSDCHGKAFMRVWFDDDNTATAIQQSLGCRIDVGRASASSEGELSYWRGRVEDFGYRYSWPVSLMMLNRRAAICESFARSGLRWYNCTLREGRSLWLFTSLQEPSDGIDVEKPGEMPFLQLRPTELDSGLIRFYLRLLPEEPFSIGDVLKQVEDGSRPEERDFLKGFAVLLVREYSRDAAVVDLDPTFDVVHGIASLVVGADTLFHQAQLSRLFLTDPRVECIDYYAVPATRYVDRSREFSIERRYIGYPLSPFGVFVEVGRTHSSKTGEGTDS